MPFYAVLTDISVVLFYLFGLFITISMKKYNLFSHFTYTLGLLANIIGLMYLPLLFFFIDFNYFAIVFSAPFTVIWHANIAINNFKLFKMKVGLSQ
ncbi:MAG: hypothetical protein JEY99_15635 [Spirochaetales bacterium]|nr:hypothetical protein [Spirochaetales bacterium]